MNKPTFTLIALLAGTSLGYAADGTVAYEKNCASCHGKDGKGETKAGRKAGAKDLTDKAHQATFSDEQAFKAIKEGMTDESGKEKMKGFADKLTDDEIRAVIAYVRTFVK